VSETVVVDVPERERYELRVDGELAGHLAYRGRTDVRALVHTEIDRDRSGQGLGSVLIAGAVDDLRARGLRLIPICPFVTRWLGEHPEHLDLVDEALRRSFGLPDPRS
jgi:predicted GNAT family acetyltransferase